MGGAGRRARGSGKNVVREKRGGENGGEKEGRRSKDKRVNKEGRELENCIEKRGWSILNGSIKGVEEGEFTYTGGRGDTVIDYILVNEEVRERMERLEIGEDVNLDHHPLIIEMKGNRGEDKGRREQKRERIVRRGVWDEEGREEFIKEIGLGLGEEGKEREIQGEIEGMKERIGKALEIGERKRGKEKRNRTGWWDEECRKRKKEVRKELRK